MKNYRFLFLKEHAEKYFQGITPTNKVRMPLAAARWILLNHPTKSIDDVQYETYVKAIGAGVYEVGLRKV